MEDSSCRDKSTELLSLQLSYAIQVMRIAASQLPYYTGCVLEREAPVMMAREILTLVSDLLDPLDREENFPEIPQKTE